MKKVISIRDRNFVGDNCSCHGAKESKYISWNRQTINDVCVFTDLCLTDVDKIQCKTKIAWLMEPRSYTPKIYNWIEQNHHKFNYILTYDQKLLSISNKFLKYNWGSCWVPTANSNCEKTKSISCIASTKRALAGHKLRHQAIQKFKYDIDAFGKEYTQLPNGAGGKRIALEPYKFSLIIENSKVNNYFTEKLIDCFYTKTIPIYYGDPTIDTIFNANGILEFTTIEELSNIISNIKSGNIEYESMFPFVEENYDICQNYMITEDHIYTTYKQIFE